MRNGNLLCWVVEFLDLAIFLHKGEFHIFWKILGVDQATEVKIIYGVLLATNVILSTSGP